MSTKTNWYNYSLLTVDTLNKIWQKLDTPLVIHFWNPAEVLSNQINTPLRDLATKLFYEERDVNFLNMEVDPSTLEYLVGTYKVYRFPTVIFYDYGKELARLDDVETLRSATLAALVEKLMVGELV
jgi:hypothetical protein